MKRSSKCLKGFFYIEGKLKLQCLTILWKSRWVGGSLNLEILRGGGSSSFGNPGGRGGQKTVPSVVGVWIFSLITHVQHLDHIILLVLYSEAEGLSSYKSTEIVIQRPQVQSMTSACSLVLFSVVPSSMSR